MIRGCSFIECNKRDHGGGVDHGGRLCLVGGRREYAGTLYLLLNFAVNLKLL